MNSDITYIFLERTDSTQRYAKAHVETLSPDGLTCVYTPYQTSGYGRKGDPWVADVNTSVLATFCFVWDGSDATELSLLGPRAVQDVLSLYGVSSELKWPNDVLVKGKKISGTLVDVTSGFALVGIGVNVKQESCEKIDQPATSFLLEGITVSPTEVLRHLAAAVEKRRLVLQSSEGILSREEFV